MSESAKAADIVARGVTEAATASKEISQNIAGVEQAATEAATGASRTQMAGQELKGLSEELRKTLTQFKTTEGNGSRKDTQSPVGGAA